MSDDADGLDGVMEHWALYEHPTDYPDKWVLRKWLIGRGWFGPTDTAFIAGTRDEVEKYVPLGLAFVPRKPEDEPHIVGVWL